MPSTALVTGASGFYGSHLCRRLIANNWEVHATGRRQPQNALPGVRFHEADFAVIGNVQEVIDAAKPDAVFHLAGSASAAPKIDLLLETHHSQVTSTLNLLTIAAQRSISRLVLIGSLMEPTGEASVIVPSSPYSAAKLAVTHYGRMAHQLFDLPVVVLRPFMTFGPRQAPSHVLPYVIRTLAAGDTPRMSSGEWETDWIYIDDVIDGMLLAATRPGVEGQVIDLGRGELTSVKNIVMRICSIMGDGVNPDFGALQDRPNETVRIADVAEAARLLGWQARVDIDDGLRRTIDWYLKAA